LRLVTFAKFQEIINMYIEPKNVIGKSATSLAQGDVVTYRNETFAVIGEVDSVGKTWLSLLPLTGNNAFSYRAGVALPRSRDQCFAVIDDTKLCLEVDGLPHGLEKLKIGLIVAREDGSHLIIQRESVEGHVKSEWTILLSKWQLVGEVDFPLDSSIGYARWKLVAISENFKIPLATYG
jgi:hypothetical protein